MRCRFELSVFFSSVKRKRGFVMGLHILLTAHTQQEEQSAALENALIQPVKIRWPDFS